MTVEVRVRRLAALGNDAIGAGLMTTAFGPGGRLTGPLGGESRAGRDPGTVRWRACGTSQPAWSPPGGRRRGGRGGRSGAGSEPSHPNPRSRPGSSRGGRLKCPASLSIVYGLRRAVHSSTDNSQIPRSRAREGPTADLTSQPPHRHGRGAPGGPGRARAHRRLAATRSGGVSLSEPVSWRAHGHQSFAASLSWPQDLQGSDRAAAAACYAE